jgi:lipopolysaccharide/colanic/teichoic acid biosynthesis glycosyltransferase
MPEQIDTAHRVEADFITDAAQAERVHTPFPRHEAFIEQTAPAPVEGRLAARIAKRALDIAFASVILVCLSPFLLLTAIAIKLDSPGPVFFRQRRIGRYGDDFEMLKFRTMIDGADDHKHKLRHLNEAAEGLFKITDDPRTTRFGRFLRSTSLDELPQFFHVLTGEMSLVGPRPLVPDEDAQLHGIDRCRTEMRPGITGPWQVSGASQIPISEMAKLDSDYVYNWTVLGDVKLILGTVPHVVLRRGV